MSPPAAHFKSAPRSDRSSSRPVKFVASDPNRGGLPVKRKQVQQACETCRHKKRKCTHAGDTIEVGLPDGPRQRRSSFPQVLLPALQADASPQGRSTLASLETNGPSSQNESQWTPPFEDPGLIDRNVLPPQKEARPQQPARFVCDSNPVGLFMEARMVGSAKVAPEKRDVGVWIPSGAFNNSGKESQLRTPRPPAIVDNCLIPFVREHCLTALPFDDDFEHLKAAYIKKIHPIFPAIPLTALNGSLQEPSNVVLRQLVCLAAAADPDVSPYLRLRNKGSNVLPPQEYSEALSSSIRATLETSLITDRVLHIRILTVLSLYAQPTCADDIDLPVQLNGWAIHHLHTLGLHHSHNDASSSDDLETLLCCVWALDRINAAMHGCPCVMHERDMGTDLESCIRKQPSCFRLFLYVVQWLDRVIDLYRPGPGAKTASLENDMYVDLPDFETMVVDADVLDVSVPLLASIEVFYHAVVILSNRKPRTGVISTTGSPVTRPTSSARQSLAAERIACSVARDHLSPIQLIPYAASLALSVEYRVMRQSPTPLSRARAMHFFKRHCEMLQKYRNQFWGANVVATLAESVLGEVEKAAATWGSTRTVHSQHDSREDPIAEPGQNNTAQHQDIRTVGPQHDRREAGFARPAQHETIPHQANVLLDVPIATTSGGMMDNAADFSLLTAGLDDAVFGHLDPIFNLNTVDDDSMGIMGVCLPFNWRDWQQ